MNDTMQFGITLLVAGMGGTLLTLLATAGIIAVLTRSFPARRPRRKERAEDPSR